MVAPSVAIANDAEAMREKAVKERMAMLSLSTVDRSTGARMGSLVWRL